MDLLKDKHDVKKLEYRNHKLRMLIQSENKNFNNSNITDKSFGLLKECDNNGSSSR